MAADDAFRDQLQALGAFIRNQRTQAEMSLRDLSRATNGVVSNPYLSQIERGLHEPSLRMLRSIAAALNLSVETLLSRAGLLDDEEAAGSGPSTVEAAVRSDPQLTPDQRADLLAVYRAYTAAPDEVPEEGAGAAPGELPDGARHPRPDPGPGSGPG